MIKVAILGAADARGGELIRILVNHPDVTLAMLCDEKYSGKDITEVHHGLVGERPMHFQSHPDATSVNIAFKLHSNKEYDAYCKNLIACGGKVVDMSSHGWNNFDPAVIPLGLSEIYRKKLVRGAVNCVVPHPVETAVLVSLFPLTLNLLLTESIQIELKASPGITIDLFELPRSEELISKVLGSVQQSFDDNVSIKVESIDENRCISTRIVIPCSVDLSTIEEMYAKVYDDHNFVVVSTKDYSFLEVEGTNRCIVTINKPDDGKLEVKSMIDSRLRGGAGEGVHAMNLLFGLHEKTGLALKASKY